MEQRRIKTPAEKLQQHLAQWRQSCHEDPPGPAEPQGRTVTVSRAEGAGGEVVADQLGAILGIPVYDREVLGLLVASPDLQREAALSLPPSGQARVDAMVGELLKEKNFEGSDLNRQVVRSVLLLWEHGPCVICGFGCVHIIPRPYTLTLRLTASPEQRAQALMVERRLDPLAAARAVYRTDAEREAYHLRFFGANLRQPHYFDLIVDTSQLGEEGAAIVAAEAFYRKFRGRAAPPSRSSAL